MCLLAVQGLSGAAGRLPAGVTSVRSASETAAGVRAFVELRRRGELAIRTSVALRIDPNLLQPDHVARIKRLGLIVHPQTWHLYNLRRNFVENYGAAYAAMSHPYRTLIRAGIPIAGGTDWPLQLADQFFYMWVEMTRATIDGEIVGEEHRLSREEALRFHTIWAATTFART